MLEMLRDWWGKDSTRSLPFLVLLFVPVALWWFSTQTALATTGLKGNVCSGKEEALEAIRAYTSKIERASTVGDPVITISTYENGNKEKRLVVRTMDNKDVIGDVLTPFVFPAAMGLLFGAWCFTACLHQLSSAQTPVKINAFRFLVVLNVAAVVYYVGFGGVLEKVF